MNWLCKLFGHKYSEIDILICNIELHAINADQLHPELRCQRCEHDLVSALRKTRDDNVARSSRMEAQ